MKLLRDTAHVIRSKNAGPLAITIDVLFPTASAYEEAVASPSLAASSIGALYGVAAGLVQRTLVPGALAIKFTMPRPCVAGSPGDRDVYGAQQHRPLLDVVL